MEATVAAHFEDKELRRKIGGDVAGGPIMAQDLINGKGNGSFILLHRYPASSYDNCLRNTTTQPVTESGAVAASLSMRYRLGLSD